MHTCTHALALASVMDVNAVGAVMRYMQICKAGLASCALGIALGSCLVCVYPTSTSLPTGHLSTLQEMRL